MRREDRRKTYDMDDDNTVKSGNISASAIHGEISKMMFPQKRRKRLKQRQWILMKHITIWVTWGK
jgi:hypothetical protein